MGLIGLTEVRPLLQGVFTAAGCEGYLVPEPTNL